MNTTRQFLKALAGLLLLTTTLNAHAIPSLTFDGTVNFDASTGILSVTSELTSTAGIVPAPQIIGSSLQFSAVLDNVYPFTDLFGTTSTVSDFIGVAGDDLTVTDGTSNTLLIGEFLHLSMFGANGQSNGVFSGNVSATGGALQSEFGSSHLLAVEFILTPSFSFGLDMFDSDFAGEIDGDLTGTPVPAPGIAALLAIGLALIVLARAHRPS